MARPGRPEDTSVPIWLKLSAADSAKMDQVLARPEFEGWTKGEWCLEIIQTALRYYTRPRPAGEPGRKRAPARPAETTPLPAEPAPLPTEDVAPPAERAPRAAERAPRAAERAPRLAEPAPPPPMETTPPPGRATSPRARPARPVVKDPPATAARRTSSSRGPEPVVPERPRLRKPPEPERSRSQRAPAPEPRQWQGLAEPEARQSRQAPGSGTRQSRREQGTPQARRGSQRRAEPEPTQQQRAEPEPTQPRRTEPEPTQQRRAEPEAPEAPEVRPDQAVPEPGEVGVADSVEVDAVDEVECSHPAEARDYQSGTCAACGAILWD